MKKKSRYAGMSPAQRHVWAHNMAIGHAVNIKQTALHIRDLASASSLAKADAQAIADLAHRLEIYLRKERIDQ